MGMGAHSSSGTPESVGEGAVEEAAYTLILDDLGGAIESAPAVHNKVASNGCDIEAVASECHAREMSNTCKLQWNHRHSSSSDGA